MLLKLVSRFSTALQQNIAEPAIKKQLLDKLQKSQEVVTTLDGYQIYVGLIIERKPIFLRQEDLEMSVTKQLYQLRKKYKLLPVVSKELFDFPLRPPGQVGGTKDEIPSHMQIDPKTGEKYFYHENSKFFLNADPEMQNPRSIQYMGCYYCYLLLKPEGSNEWVFPTMPINETQSFAEAKLALYQQICKKEFNILSKSKNPLVVTVRDFPNNENLRIKGIKTFYFVGQHVDGAIKLYDQWVGDYNWVPRGKMNKYLTREDYKDFIGGFIV